MKTVHIAATLALASSRCAAPIPATGRDAPAGDRDRAGGRIAPETVEQFRRCAERLASSDRFSGVMLVEQDGTPLLEFSNAAEGSGPIAMDTPFNIASAAKMFTAVAIGQLVDQGKVKLDARLGDYLGELPRDLAQVRVDQALTHSGGIAALTRITPQLAAQLRSSSRARDLVPLVVDAGLSFPPGSKSEYSNGGFILLGAVVESVSGMSFRDYVARNIFSRATMISTSAEQPPGAAARLSRMAPAAPPGGRAETRMGAGATPAGGWYSSARDLARFAEALRAHRLVSRSTLEAMLTIRSDPGSAGRSPPSLGRRGYGHGFGITETAGDTIAGHNGGAPGANAEVAISMRRGWTVVVLSNIDPPAATNLMTFARQVIGGNSATTAECERIGSLPGPFDARE